MLGAIRTGLVEFRALLDWAPDWAVAGTILLLAAILALSVHGVTVRLLRRLLAERHPYVRSFLVATSGLTRIALLIIALFIVLPATPIDSQARVVIAQILTVLSIIVIGWGLITAVNMAADLYLLRFKLGVADNLLARKHLTQIRVLTRTVNTLLIIATIGAALMTFDSVRQYGVSLFASAGVAGLVAGLAARPVLSNLFAGIQIAMTQPIRIDDGVVVEGEYGQVEEITSTYVVVRLWDMRRMIVPLTHFIEKPFQNWTRELGNQLGAVLLPVDYTTPVERVRAKALEIIAASPLWDGQTAKVQVTNANDTTIELRILVSAKSADVFDLRCYVRENLIAFLQHEMPGALPRVRQQTLDPSPDRTDAGTRDNRPS